jgi:hypothetical protein
MSTHTGRAGHRVAVVGMREFKISQGEIHSSVTRMIKAAPYRAGTLIIHYALLLYYKTHTATQGSQRNNPLSQQVSLSCSRSGHAQWKRTNRATQTGHIRQKISPGVHHRLTQGQHKLGYKVVCGHTQPHTEMRPTRPSEPADTAAIQQEVAPAQPYANLSQGARYKGHPRNPTRA